MSNQKNNRKTKIVCTIGPATSSPEMIRRLIEAGMDVARLNFSHGTHDSHDKAIRDLRRVSREVGREIGILMDLAGPKIRLGHIPAHERTLEPGTEVILVSGQSSTGDELPVNYPGLYEDVAVGDRILIADGQVELCVLDKKNQLIYCEVVVGGVVTSNKGVNLPTSNLRTPTFTEKDRRDLKFGLSRDVDIVAMSFVRHEKDLDPLREILNKMKRPSLLVAKIEKPEALENLHGILGVVDGMMVARGDLGVEMPLAEVPLIQKRVIKEARQAGKAVITATQMLGSMLSSPRPSRAEVTDVANAILDGTDAVMLSDETAMGRYPVEAVKVLDRICKATEPQLASERFLDEELSALLPATAAALSRAVSWLARDLKPAAIVAATTSGSTARIIARYRPPQPVVGLTPEIRTCRQLCLSWGVLPALIPESENADEVFNLVRKWAEETGLAGAGDRLIVTAGVPFKVPGTTNLIKIIEMGGPSQH
ncbi:MAG: pyruvate kinase [Deltaproteobacteria bacterium]|nr:pyruvate kinase [Deltaproteobacteria bacterium]MBW2051183.1 pyruvate kinase [Deltaproteobacteria bacterium]MBW2140483.1 pyruvate kinase [Deltaproteobacteria bacterium]MBW2322209.1 pyruvate kinase [Deltaproteobacteria bacterium]